MPFQDQFLPLIDFMRNSDISAEALEFAIEMRGLWKRRGDDFEHLSADSKEVRLVVRYIHSHDVAWLSGRDEEEQLENDPKGKIYGWPSRKKPAFEFFEPMRTSKLRTISFFLDKDQPEPHAALAAEIESNGVWGFDKNGNLKHFGPESRQALEALVIISLRMEAGTDYDHPYWHGFYDESDVSGSYGWPSGNLPNFRCDEEFGWGASFHRLQSLSAMFKTDLYTIGRILLMRKANPSGIMTAIERQHVYGYDRFGKLRAFNHYDPALEPLTSCLAEYADILLGGEQPDASLLEAKPYCRFGWPREKLPDFAAIEGEEIPEPQSARIDTQPVVVRAVPGDQELNPKSEKAYLATIGALLMFIRGDLGEGRHPGYQSQQQLIDLIDEQADLPGARDSSLKKKFAAANKLLNELGITTDEPPAHRTGTG